MNMQYVEMMNRYYWHHPVTVNRLAMGRLFMRNLAAQGKSADCVAINGVILSLEDILRCAPVTSVYCQYHREIEEMIYKLRAAHNHTTSPAMKTHSQETITDEPALKRRKSTPTYPAMESDSQETITDAPAPKRRKSGNGPNTRNELDSFASSRREAIEATVVADTESFPFFCEIAGLDEAKNAMIEALVDPVQYPDYFQNSDLKPWKTVLLYGPPGTGKTILSKAVVREINGMLYELSSSDLISSWQGQSERLIRELFDHALQQEKTVVIFIDEVDSLCRTRSSNEDDASRRVKTELLVQMQRLKQSSRLILICATNCPWELDPAFLRRLEKKIYAGLPDLKARAEILMSNLKKTTFEPGIDALYLANRSDGFSGDDLARFSAELAYEQFRKHKNSGHQLSSSWKPPLFAVDVQKVLDNFHPSVDSQQLARFQQFMSKR